MDLDHWSTDLVQVWEEVAVPEPPPKGALCRMLASGGEF